MPVAAIARRRVRVEMRPEDDSVTVIGGTGMPDGEGADATGSVIVTELAFYVVLVWEGA